MDTYLLRILISELMNKWCNYSSWVRLIVFTVLFSVWWAWGVFCWEDPLTAGFADVLRQYAILIVPQQGLGTRICCSKLFLGGKSWSLPHETSEMSKPHVCVLQVLTRRPSLELIVRNRSRLSEKNQKSARELWNFNFRLLSELTETL